LHVPAVSSFATVYEAVYSSDRSRWEIEIPGDGTTFDALDGTLVLPNNPSLIGLGDITASAASTDSGASTVITTTDKDAIEIQSSGLPEAPVVGWSEDFAVSGMRSILQGNEAQIQLPVAWVVRAPAMSPGQVFEIFYEGVGREAGWNALDWYIVDSQGQRIGTDIYDVNLTDSAAAGVTGIRLTYEELDGAYVSLTANNPGSDQATMFAARVGAVDGYVDGDGNGDVRYVYSAMAEGSWNGEWYAPTTGERHGSPLDDFLRLEDSVFALAGDDFVFLDGSALTEPGNIYVLADGGAGRDTLSLDDMYRVTGSDGSILVDLNEGAFTAIYEDPNTGEDKILSARVSNFEIVLGSAGSDYIIGRGDSAESQVLRGKAGDDYLVGGAGDDVLEGGAGSDYLIGGAGADTFLVSATSEIDVIDDLDISAGDRVVFRDPSFDVGSVQLVRVADLLASNEVDGQRLASMALSDQDWVVRSPSHSSLAILLSGTSALASSAVMASVVSSAGSGIDYDAADPQTNDLVPSIWEGAGSVWDQREIEVPLVDLAAAAERPSTASNTLLDSFFGETNNFDDISQTLGVIADAKFEKAYAAQANEMTLINPAIDGNSFVGFSGSAGDDVLIADGQDSVLIGGSGGSDRLIGDSGDDILIAAVQSTRDENDTVSMQGGGGADLFVFANIAPDEVTDSLNAIYKVRIEDFNRDEGDRVVLAGYGDGAQVGNIAQIGEVTTTEDGRYEQAVTVFSDLTSPDETGLSVVFDISFMRQFDSEFQLRLADFDAL